MNKTLEETGESVDRPAVCGICYSTARIVSGGWAGRKTVKCSNSMCKVALGVDDWHGSISGAIDSWNTRQALNKEDGE